MPLANAIFEALGAIVGLMQLWGISSVPHAVTAGIGVACAVVIGVLWRAGVRQIAEQQRENAERQRDSEELPSRIIAKIMSSPEALAVLTQYAPKAAVASPQEREKVITAIVTATGSGTIRLPPLGAFRVTGE